MSAAALAALCAAVGRFLIGTIVFVCALAAHSEAAIVADVPVGVGGLRLAAPLAGNLLRVGDVGEQNAPVAVGGVPPNGIKMFLRLSLISRLGDGYSCYNRHRQARNH